MESLARLGLIEWIGGLTENIILSVSEGSRLTVAILIILWVSAIVSAFVDNIPLTTMMIRIVISLAEKKVLNLPLQPLAWALSFGACLGGKQNDLYLKIFETRNRNGNNFIFHRKWNDYWRFCEYCCH